MWTLISPTGISIPVPDNLAFQLLSVANKSLNTAYLPPQPVSYPKPAKEPIYKKSRHRVNKENANSHWRPNEDLLLVQLHREGKRKATIAKTLGRSKSSVQTRLWQINTGRVIVEGIIPVLTNLTKFRKGYTKHQYTIDENGLILNTNGNWKELVELAKKFGVSTQSVYMRFRRLKGEV